VLPTGALPHFEAPSEFFRYYDAWCARLGERSRVETAPTRGLARTSVQPGDIAVCG
jgi:hypothetical protein